MARAMSGRMHFAWSDPQGNVTNGYYEKPDAVALDFPAQPLETFDHLSKLNSHRLKVMTALIGRLGLNIRSTALCVIGMSRLA